MSVKTYNCVTCAFNLKRRKATHWCGNVLKVDHKERKRLLAGFCRYHRIDSAPVLAHLGTGCVAVWTADMGVS